MTNKELSIILRLRDEASKRLEGVRGSLQRFANSWKKNWLAITAAVTAAIMALRKAWDLMQMGAKAEQIEESFNRMAESVGINGQQMKQALMEASHATVNFSNIADKASALMAQGLNMDTVAALMKQARVEAKIFGSTTEEAFQNITSAVTGGLVTTLRRTYGLQLSLKDAADDYAKATGKTSEEVKKYHMAQALANHILDKSKSHLEAVNLEVMSNYEKVQRLKSQWNEFAEKTGQALWQVLGFIQGFMNQLVAGFFQLLEVATTVFQKMLVPLIKLYELLGKLPGKVGEAYRQAGESVKKLSSDMEANKQAFEMASIESAKTAMEQYDLVFAKVKETGDNTAEILKNVAKQVGDSAKDAAEKFNAMEEFAKQSARNMQNAFSEFFFKAFTGELRNMQEIFANFGRAVLQMISNILAKLLLIKLFTAMAGPGGKIFGVDVGALFHQGGMIRRHQGGLIRAHAGLAPDEVPIIAQTGEGILSRQGVRALGGPDNLRSLNRGEEGAAGGVTININQVIQAWDAQDVWRNRKALSNAIADDIYNNGKIRSVIRSYT
ncbi:MAG: hypothetical protein A2Y00_05520 [Omnitrophica WOR_2 bacterium GWF2_43_52]|nr:MAG: hypothetical protein A2Y01_07390 [Omnitrophica WOR_2 bacterium GWC2_44_8]OGX20559.1 MAG: hypothetical protein A2Y00_05520 [Omnitrophica WOR_2 bacterium GWF2_43_52]HAH21625.1 hypothetical protein [Candidatus Omnitrophota bacterium]HBG64218.1 hypothetical protein [Candidatus Omnitrophota bacterium]